jgi:competence protein ComEC
VVILLPLLLASCVRTTHPAQKAFSAVTFLDVGQGEAALIRTPSGKTILIDAGSDNCGSDTLLARMGVVRIDDFLLTHPHEDHYGNLRRILGSFAVGRVIFNRPGFPRGADAGFARLFSYIMDSLRLDTFVFSAGRSLEEDSLCSIFCLWPDTAPLSPDIEDTVNALSLVLQVRLGPSSIIFTGDINFSVEKRVVEARELRGIVLKVAHHGSKYATSHEFLDAVAPLISVISAGTGNPFGHPDGETLARLASCGGKIFRTDRDGSVKLWFDAEGNMLLGGD